MNNFRDFGIAPVLDNFTGEKIKTAKILDKEIIVKDFKVVQSKFEGAGLCLHLQIVYDDDPRVVFTRGKYLIQTIEKIPRDKFPFRTKIIKNGEILEFS